MEEYIDLLGEQERTELDEDLRWCKAQLERSDATPDQLKEAIDRLEGSAHRIYEIMYNEAASMEDAGDSDSTET